MAVPADINPRIVDSLYCDALALADELRARFAFPLDASADGGLAELDDEARVALSCEGLRATTRTMHCLAWLLNHRAFFAGEISEFQLRRHGRLPAALPRQRCLGAARRGRPAGPRERAALRPDRPPRTRLARARWRAAAAPLGRTPAPAAGGGALTTPVDRAASVRFQEGVGLAEVAAARGSRDKPIAGWDAGR